MTRGALTLADTLRRLSHLAEIRGSHREASDLLRAHAAVDALEADDVADLLRRARRRALDVTPGITAALHGRLHDLATCGFTTAIRAATAAIPALLRRLLESSAITSDEGRRLATDLGVLTYPDLVVALDDRRVSPVLGSTVDDRLRAALPSLERAFHPTPLGRALDLIEHVAAAIRSECPAIEELGSSGDARRFSPGVSSVLIAGWAHDPPAALDQVRGMTSLDEVLHQGARRAILSVRGSEIDLRVSARDEYGSVLFLTTGPRAHVRTIQQRRAAPALFPREAAVYQHASLPYIAPELREDDETVTAAAAGRLPALISREHIRGDLHTHTTWSDGRDSIEAIVQAARALAYEYIAITDHSERAAAARTVSRHQLAWQREEIVNLSERYPDIAILHGIEVDILEDGSLDFPDALLEPLDIVLASLHESRGQDGPALTRRYMRAMRNPLVSIITHPANRLPGNHEGYSLDWQDLYAVAAETGTALEIDGGPGHLDLDGARAREAVLASVTLAIDSDGHRATALARQMRMGVGTARRGWVEARHVLNARPVEAVRAFVAKKRART